MNVQFCRGLNIAGGLFTNCGAILTAISTYSLLCELPLVCIFIFHFYVFHVLLFDFDFRFYFKFSFYIYTFTFHDDYLFHFKFSTCVDWLPQVCCFIFKSSFDFPLLLSRTSSVINAERMKVYSWGGWVMQQILCRNTINTLLSNHCSLSKLLVSEEKMIVSKMHLS